MWWCFFGEMFKESCNEDDDSEVKKEGWGVCGYWIWLYGIDDDKNYCGDASEGESEAACAVDVVVDFDAVVVEGCAVWVVSFEIYRSVVL